MPNTPNEGESRAEIKTPVRFDSQFGIVDANDCCLNRDEIVAALNEAAALREEVEGLRRDKARLDACESEAMSTVFHMFSSKEGPVWDHLELTRCGEVFRGKTFREVIDTAIAKENA